MGCEAELGGQPAFQRFNPEPTRPQPLALWSKLERGTIEVMKAILPFVLNATAALSGAPGIWELKIDDTTIFRFELQDTQNGAAVTWERPEHFRFDGDTFSKVTGPVV